MAGRTALERGAQAAGRAIEETRRLGLTKDVVLNHFLYHEESGGVRGALNAAENACYSGEIVPEQKVEYAQGWVITLAEALANRL
jgi:hypothetical protein